MRNRLPAAFSLDPRRFRDRRFWIVQVLVLALAASHALLEGRGDLPHSTSLYFVPETLFLIPVGYAALNFGLHGAVATAMWSTALALPNLFVFHQGDQFAAAATQLIIVIAVALFVGYRVEEERLARRRADAARDALAASERRYRGLFLNSTAAVVVFDRAGRIHEANPATTKLLGSADVIGLELSDVVGSEASERLLAAPAATPAGHVPGAFVLPGPHGSEVLVEPTSTAFTGPDGQPWIQSSLHDVTEQQRRQARLRSYAARILVAQEEERRRIAQELHDETLQQVVVVQRQLHAIEETLPSAGDTAHATVSQALSTTEDLMDSLRVFTHQLRPPALDELGVVICLRRLVVEFHEQTAIDASVAIDGEERRVGSDRELALFRIAQEALRNVERHAHASTLRLTLAFGADRVALTVLDDGRGFEYPPSTVEDSRSGLGLLGMQERAALLGGEFRISTRPGMGTQVTSVIPA